MHKIKHTFYKNWSVHVCAREYSLSYAIRAFILKYLVGKFAHLCINICINNIKIVKIIYLLKSITS
jgi:hypothetical protein